jgi:hypothetical protein
MDQLDLMAYTAPERAESEDLTVSSADADVIAELIETRPGPTPAMLREFDRRPTIEQRWLAWSAANRHVLAELLRLARAHLDRGVTYLSVKKLWEECRVTLDATRDDGYRLNNDYTASAGRWLIEQEPRLATVIRTRSTK